MEELITIKEAAQLVKKSSTTIRLWIKEGKLKNVYKENVMKVDKSELFEYNTILKSPHKHFIPYNFSLDWDESCKNLDSYVRTNSMIEPYKYAFNPIVWVSNKGKIISTKGYAKLLKSQKTTNGYYQVKLPNGILDEVHRLVAYVWCQNGKFKSEVHHIDCKKHNNNYKNLIWVTKEEHHKLHKLLEENKKHEYRELIKKIEKENKCTEKLKCIIHPDYKSDEKNNYYMYITEKAYNSLNDDRTQNNIPLSEIKGEAVFSKIL